MVLSPNGNGSLACDVAFDDVVLVKGGARVDLSESGARRLTEALAGCEVDLTVDLNRGGSSSLVYFSDLTHDYVRLNAGYRT
jgi:N-acetylglutamate synthase/N-acetylornithine aminotransferase